MDSEASLITGNNVAIIGIGITGLAAIKSLREQGFNVVAFERNERIGGVWRWCANRNRTTIITSTRANTLKHFACYQDFPFPKDVPDYPTGEQITSYIDSYASHFDLLKHCQLGVDLEIIQLHQDGVKWDLRLRDKAGSRLETYDKVLFATGPDNTSWIPKSPGMETYKGNIVHAQAYKSPDDYAGQTIVVVGMSNSGCDIAVELLSGAKEVYLSHRSGARILIRMDNGKPTDHLVTRRVSGMLNTLARYFPNIGNAVFEKVTEFNMRKNFPKIDPTWRLLPAPPFDSAPGVLNEDIIPKLITGEITSLHGIKQFTERGIITDSGETIEVDSVIYATGYHFDYSVLSHEADPTAYDMPEWDQAEHHNGLRFPRLYMTYFSTKFPMSLAFIGPCRGHSFSAFTSNELATQAIAQAWKGNYPLPSRHEMEKWCDANYQFCLGQISEWRVSDTGTHPDKLEEWLIQASGNGLNEMLGWGWKAWKFWWKERELYELIMSGVDTPYVYRLFDGRLGSRAKWEGARDAIFQANGRTPPPHAL